MTDNNCQLDKTASSAFLKYLIVLIKLNEIHGKYILLVYNKLIITIYVEEVAHRHNCYMEKKIKNMYLTSNLIFFIVPVPKPMFKKR